MTLAEQLTPQRVCALLDGEAEPAARRDWERALATDPEATRQLATWRRNDDALRAAFGIRRPEARDDRPSSLSPIGPLLARDLSRGPNLVALAVGGAFVAGALCAAAIMLLLHMLRTP